MAEEVSGGRRGLMVAAWVGGAVVALGVGAVVVWVMGGKAAEAPAVSAASETAEVTPEAATEAVYESPPDTPPVVTTMPAHLNKGQLLKLAEAREGAVKDLAVEYEYVPVEGVLGQQIGFHCKVAAKGDKLYTDEAYGVGQDMSRSRTISAFNGEQWVQFDCSDSMALIGKQQMQSMPWQETGWFEVAMVGSPGHVGSGGRDGSLAALLNSAGCLVHLNMQDVEGHPCVVVDDVGWGGVRERVWVDPARGLLPLRLSYWSGGSEVGVFRVLDVAQVGGVWLPTLAERRMGGSISKLEVRDRGTAHMGLHVNAGLADDAFDLEKKLPADAIVARSGATVQMPPPRRGARRRMKRSDFDPGLPGE